MKLRIAHLYPDVMNIYGDQGNIIALRHRCESRGIEVEVIDINIGDPFDPSAVDLVVIGGGQDREQRRIADDLLAKGPALKAAVEEDLPVLAVCGGFQLFGHRYVGLDGDDIPGIGIFDMETRHPGVEADRCIGDVVLATEFGEVVGFENHGGRTYLATGQTPFGAVVHGHGNNNGADHTEGARYRNAVGTYLHGSVLPKNPALADGLIEMALKRHYGPDTTLEPHDDAPEMAAHATAARTASRRASERAAGHNPSAFVRRLRGRMRDLAGR